MTAQKHVYFRNDGEADIRALTTFGVNVKARDNPIGFFGTGFKYAIAVLLRERQKVDMWIGHRHFSFDFEVKDIRGKPFEVVELIEHVDGEAPQYGSLAFTTELGSTWMLWQAFRELYSNTFDEADAAVSDVDVMLPTKGTTLIRVRGDAFHSVYQERDSIFLTGAPLYALKGVDVHDRLDNNWLYYKGIRVLELPKPGLFTYNITDGLELTENRTVSSMYSVFMKLAHAIGGSTDAGFVRKVLEANQRYFESRIDFNWWDFRPDDTFNTVVRRMISSGSSFNSSVGHVYKEHIDTTQIPITIQPELLSLEQRKVLRLALMFWEEVGTVIDRGMIHITEENTRNTLGHIYLTKAALDMPVDKLAGLIYKQWLDIKHRTSRNLKVSEESLLIDALVEQGKTIIKLKSAARHRAA